VVGIVTEKEFRAGIKVTSARAIIDWLVPILTSREDLKDGTNSLESWTNRDMHRALNPDMCASGNSCVSNIRIATELQRVAENGVKFEAFKPAQLEKLRCPLYTAALVREIEPQNGFLKQKLTSLGWGSATPGYVFARYATSLLESPRYTGNTKMASLEFAEATLPRDLDAVLQRDPDILLGAICASGLNAEQTEAVESIVDQYLTNFGRRGVTQPRARSDTCPRDLSTAQLKQVKDLTATLADIKLSQASFVKRMGESSDASSSTAASALAALVNAGDKKGANALIDLGNNLIEKDPGLAASAFAKAFKIDQSNMVIRSFGDAVSRSPELQAKVKDPKKTIKSFPTIDQHTMANIIKGTGLILPGVPRF
jgi:hypothetical protein